MIKIEATVKFTDIWDFDYEETTLKRIEKVLRYTLEEEADVDNVKIIALDWNPIKEE